MFVVDTFYIVEPALAGPHKLAHKAFVEKYIDDGTFLYAGPKPDGTGGIIIAEGRDAEQVAGIMREDAFVSEGIVGMNIAQFDPLFSSRK